MTIYVDPLMSFLRNKKWNHNKSCRLVADTLEELHSFAASTGMNMLWFQVGSSFPHYDLTEGMRSKAVKAGAVEIAIRESAYKNRCHT